MGNIKQIDERGGEGKGGSVPVFTAEEPGGDGGDGPIYFSVQYVGIEIRHLHCFFAIYCMQTIGWCQKVKIHKTNINVEKPIV